MFCLPWVLVFWARLLYASRCGVKGGLGGFGVWDADWGGSA